MAGKKIHFKKSFSDGSQREEEGILYTAQNGIKVALHKEVHPNGSTWWSATELTTGKKVTRSIYKTMKEAKAEVETVSPVVAKVLAEGKNSFKRVTPAKKDKPKKAVAPVKAKPASVQKPKATTYTVMGKTFATKAEARAYKALQKQKAGKPCEIKEGTRKPSHKVVSFTAKSK